MEKKDGKKSFLLHLETKQILQEKSNHLPIAFFDSSDIVLEDEII